MQPFYGRRVLLPQLAPVSGIEVLRDVAIGNGSSISDSFHKTFMFEGGKLISLLFKFTTMLKMEYDVSAPIGCTK